MKESGGERALPLIMTWCPDKRAVNTGAAAGTSVKVQMTSKRSPGQVWGMTVPGMAGSEEASAGM